ncbi:MAG: RedB protein [Deltaproteobacteria bacterium]|nr:RedB protein [Deltaproteobacteria bacterium]MBI3295671.1 RedB protein [Deltaproteobacteria bacterium]
MGKKWRLTVAGLVVWIAGMAVGQIWLRKYALTAGPTERAAASWPKHSQLERAEGFTAILFLHPKCPCSQASLLELDKFMTHAPRSTKAYAVFARPSAWAEKDVKGSLWKQATAFPRVVPVIDEKKREAAQFGALTSGHFFLYRPDGVLAFQGGITGSRGDVSDNPGLSSALALVNHGRVELRETRVFGCALYDKSGSIFSAG